MKEEETIISSTPKGGAYRIREKWLEGISIPGKDEKLFELEMLLRAFDRFFNVKNLPISDFENVVIRNFHAELKVALMGIERCIALLRALLPKEDANIFNFQMYLENTLLIDYARDRFVLSNLRQSHPKESLYLILLAFINFSVMIKTLLKLKHIPFITFHHTGQVITREIAINRFFNPLEMPAFTPRYDKITNPILRKSIQNLKNSAIRSVYSIVMLAILRDLKYLDYVNPEAPSKDELKSSVLIFSLIRSDIQSIISYIETEGTGRIKESKLSENDKIFYLEKLDSLSFQIEIEAKKTFRHVLRGVLEQTSFHALRSSVENAKGILKNILEEAVVTLAKSGDESVEGKLIFPDYTSRFEQSSRLREDIFIFIKLLEAMEESLDGSGEAKIPKHRVLDIIKDYIAYFMNLSFNYVRYSDSEEFIDFFNYISSLNQEDLQNSRKFNEFRFKIHVFRTFLETILGLINNRAELAGIPIDEDHAYEIYRQFV